MYILRDYQQEAVTAAVNFFKNPGSKNSIIILPTGSGKSLVIAAIAKEMKESILIFQPSKEILEQNHAKMLSYGYEASIFSASLNSKNVSRITFATIGSVINKAELFNSFKYIIVDECHLVNSKGGMYKNFFDGINAKILGLTATPYRLTSDGFGGAILKFITRTRPRVFSEVIYYVQNERLFNEGFLSPLAYVEIRGFDADSIKRNSTGADFDDDDLQKYYDAIDHAKRIENVIKNIKDKRKGILVFNKFVSESEFLQEQVSQSAVVTAKTPKAERENIIAAFRNGEIRVVFNVGVLSVGFDYPELDTVVLARPTLSLALYYQMIGRSIRPHPDKQSAMIIDLCGNYQRFGRIEDLKIYDKNQLYFIANKERQLTNVYYTDRKPLEDALSLTLPFGKYKGVNLKDVPRNYLAWVNQNVQIRDESLRLKIKELAAERKG